MEVARGTAVTRGPLEACPARALAQVSVTVSVHHSGARTLAGCRGRPHSVRAGPGSQRPRRGGGGWTHAGSPGRRTPGHRARSGCPGSWVCTRSVPPAGPCGRRCPGSQRRCSHSLQGGGGREAGLSGPAKPTFPPKTPRFSRHAYKTERRQKPYEGKADTSENQRCAIT